jgi:hypothetical protein
MKLNGIPLWALALLGAAAAPALAALGGNPESVQAEQARMKAALRLSTTGGITVHEISTGDGSSVREYAGADGRVFAMAWNGPGNPDLKRLLGNYYARYQQAGASAHGNHRHLAIKQPDLMFENSGRMRAFAGRAWVPALLPQNFSTDDIR